MAKGKRNYKEEYRKHQSSPEDIARRSERNKDRAAFEKRNGDLPTDIHVHHVGGKMDGRLVAKKAKDNLGHPDPDKDGGRGSRQKKRKKALLRALKKKS